MARQIIDTGTLALNGQDGDTNREAAEKSNANFQELYGQQENFVRGAGVVAGGSVAVFDGTTGTQLASKPLSDFEPALAVGTAAQYRNGLKQLIDFATSVRASVLSGISFTSSAAVVAADTILAAIGKLQGQLNNLVKVSSNTDTTAGRLVTVGYRGAPGSGALVNEGNAINPDNYLTAGSFYGEFAIAEWAGAGQPTTNVIGWLTVTPGTNTATYCAQTFTNAAGGFTFVRAKASGVWGRWAKQFNVINAEQDPQSSLGLMSSTVVSGWVVSKYINGEIVLVSSLDPLTSFASNELRVVDVTIPVTLISSKPSIALATLTPASVYDFTVPSTWMPGPTSVRIAVKNGGTAQIFNRSIMVRGMWK